MTESERSIVIDLLYKLIQSAEKVATENELSNDRVMDHVWDCQRKIERLKAVMGSWQEGNAEDGIAGNEDWDALRSDDGIKNLMSQADKSLRRCIEKLSARMQGVANELNSVRLTQRATRAYQGIHG